MYTGFYAPADDECWIKLAEEIISDMADCYSCMYCNTIRNKLDENGDILLDNDGEPITYDICKSQEDYYKYDEPFYNKRRVMLKRFKSSPVLSFIREDKLEHGLNERLRQNMREHGIRWEANR